MTAAYRGIPDDPADNRRYCDACAACEPFGCTSPERSLLQVVRTPEPEVVDPWPPGRCRGFRPAPHDTDQRSAAERWPGMDWPEQVAPAVEKPEASRERRRRPPDLEPSARAERPSQHSTRVPREQAALL